MTARTAELYKQTLQEYSNQAVSSDRLATLHDQKKCFQRAEIESQGSRDKEAHPCTGGSLLQAFGHDECSRAASSRQLLKLSSGMLQSMDLQPYDARVLQQCARRFALLYTSLTEHFADGFSWRVKPKFHFLMYLAEASTCPKEFWRYRDED